MVIDKFVSTMKVISVACENGHHVVCNVGGLIILQLYVHEIPIVGAYAHYFKHLASAFTSGGFAYRFKP